MKTIKFTYFTPEEFLDANPVTFPPRLRSCNRVLPNCTYAFQGLRSTTQFSDNKNIPYI